MNMDPSSSGGSLDICEWEAGSVPGAALGSMEFCLPAKSLHRPGLKGLCKESISRVLTVRLQGVRPLCLLLCLSEVCLQTLPSSLSKVHNSSH